MTLLVVDNFAGDYRFLSNFYRCTILYEDILYSSTEAAYQAAKTLDHDSRKWISQLGPSYAKEVGQKLVIREDWNDVKYDIMFELVTKKFEDRVLRKKLLATGDALLIEGNWWHDNFWGNCGCQKCVDIEGLNNLGKILMLVRQRARNA